MNHTFNATLPERLQQYPLLYTTNRTDRTFFLWRFHTSWPSHPGHSTILLRPESPSGMCAKLPTVAASNNRVHAPQSISVYVRHQVQSFTRWYRQSFHAAITLLLLVRATCIYCCSSRTSRSWWITHSMQRHRRGCNPGYLVIAWLLLRPRTVWFIATSFELLPRNNVFSGVAVVVLTGPKFFRWWTKNFSRISWRQNTIPCFCRYWRNGIVVTVTRHFTRLALSCNTKKKSGIADFRLSEKTWALSNLKLFILSKTLHKQQLVIGYIFMRKHSTTGLLKRPWAANIWKTQDFEAKLHTYKSESIFDFQGCIPALVRAGT